MLDFSQKDITDFFNENMHLHNKRDLYLNSLPKSGYALIKKIPADAYVLDVGCGKNLFKKHFPNLEGIDVIGTECDQKVALLDYVTSKKFDVVLCLGSIFGSLNDIKQQIMHIKTMLKPNSKIYWRNHPALSKWGYFPDFFYRWTEKTHYILAEELGFTVNEACKELFVDLNNNLRYRIYAEWTLN